MRHPSIGSAPSLLLGFGLLAAALPAEAAEIPWRLSAGGTFNSAASWGGGVVPGASDVARFALTANTFPPPIPAVYLVSFTAQASTQGLIVEDDFVTLDLNGRIYRTPGADNRIGTFPGRSGQLVVVDGFWEDNLSGTLEIGSTGRGTLIVSTGGSIFGETLRVGSGGGGSGTLIIQNGGVVTSPGIIVGIASPATATVTGANSRLSLQTLNVGAGSNSTLSVLAAGHVDNSGPAFIGNDPFTATTGTINVDGTGSLWSNSGDVRVGTEGNGFVEISGGGRAALNSIYIGRGNEVTTSAGAGTVSVHGTNSRLACGAMAIGQIGAGVLTIADGGGVLVVGGKLTVGRSGDGEMHVFAGGRLEAGETILGGESGSATGSAIVTVSGAGSQWINAADLKLSNLSPASLAISAGATVQDDNAFVGFGIGPSDGEAVVDGPNSTWINQGSFVVGNRGLGTVTISNQGRVTSVTGIVGAELGTNDPVFLGRGIGSVTVDGAGSEWANSGTLVVGQSGAGTLNIVASAVVRTGIGLIGDQVGGVGSVHVDGPGSRWISTGFTGIGFLGAGELTIGNGGSVQAQDLLVDSNGRLSGGGTITGNLRNGGTVIAGAAGSIGSLQVSGTYEQLTGGFLDIEIGGSSTDHTDLLAVGVAMLDGILRLRLLPGTVPAVNVALAATSLSGQFDNVVNGQRLTTVDGFGSFIVNYGPGSAFNPNQVVLSNFLETAPSVLFRSSFESP
jgi:T5SS/PEP-CTERM-associated repeat protein